MNQQLTVVVSTIAAGESLSDTIFTGGLPVCAIQMPAGWDAAALTFQAAGDLAASVANVYDKEGTELSATVAASRFIQLDPALLAGAKYLKIRSGTAGTAVNQTAERKLVVVLRVI